MALFTEIYADHVGLLEGVDVSLGGDQARAVKRRKQLPPLSTNGSTSVRKNADSCLFSRLIIWTVDCLVFN